LFDIQIIYCPFVQDPILCAVSGNTLEWLGNKCSETVIQKFDVFMPKYCMFSVTLGLYVHAITTCLRVLQHVDLCRQTSVVPQRKDANVGMWTLVGLTSNQDAMPPQSTTSALH